MKSILIGSILNGLLLGETTSNHPKVKCLRLGQELSHGKWDVANKQLFIITILSKQQLGPSPSVLSLSNVPKIPPHAATQDPLGPSLSQMGKGFLILRQIMCNCQLTPISLVICPKNRKTRGFPFFFADTL